MITFTGALLLSANACLFTEHQHVIFLNIKLCFAAERLDVKLLNSEQLDVWLLKM